MTLMLPLITAQRVSAGLLLGASTDDVHPTLMGAMVRHDRIVSTDRYLISEILAEDLPALTGNQPIMYEAHRPIQESRWDMARGDSEDYFIPNDALTWAVKITHNSLRMGKPLAENYLVEWVPDVEKRVVTAYLHAPDGTQERSQTFDVPGGNYPPVEKLTERWEPSLDAYEVGLPAKRMSAVLAFIAKHSDRPAVFKLGSKGNEPYKSVPFRVTGAGVRFTLQPEMI